MRFDSSKSWAKHLLSKWIKSFFLWFKAATFCNPYSVCLISDGLIPAIIFAYTQSQMYLACIILGMVAG